MPAVNEKVMAMVERELKKNPKVKASELQAKAKKISRSIGKLSIRQFHAKYPLQVKRKSAPKKPKRAKPRKTRQKTRTAQGPEVTREAIRGVLLKFAKDVAAAEDQSALVDIIAGLDKYVDQVAKAANA